MKDPRETALRYLAILNLIPRLPGRIATPTLQQKLSERGIDIDLRSLQRDLKDKLSLHFPLICHDNERPYRWSFTAGAHLDLPALNTPGALTLYLAEEQLRGLLPQTVADQLKPQFDAARKHLQHLQDNGMAHWAKSVRAMPNGKALLPAEIPHDSWHHVTEALLHKKQLQVVYLSRASGEAKTFQLHPYGLVSRYSSSYLVARVEGFEDLRHYALHRIQQADVLAESAITDPNFDIDAYIETGTFARRLSQQRVELVADIHPQVAWLLTETPLSKTQQILPIPATEVAQEGWQRLVAIVTLDKETLWWIYAMNNQIRLHAPQQWVDEIRHTTADLNMFYQAQQACHPF